MMTSFPYEKSDLDPLIEAARKVLGKTPHDKPREGKAEFCTHLGYDTTAPCSESCPKAQPQPSGEGWEDDLLNFKKSGIYWVDGAEYNVHEDTLKSFINAIISRSEARAIEDREKMTFIIRAIKSHSPDGEIGTLCDTALREVLSAPRE